MSRATLYGAVALSPRTHGARVTELHQKRLEYVAYTHGDHVFTPWCPSVHTSARHGFSHSRSRVPPLPAQYPRVPSQDAVAASRRATMAEISPRLAESNVYTTRASFVLSRRSRGCAPGRVARGGHAAEVDIRTTAAATCGRACCSRGSEMDTAVHAAAATMQSAPLVARSQQHHEAPGTASTMPRT